MTVHYLLLFDFFLKHVFLSWLFCQLGCQVTHNIEYLARLLAQNRLILCDFVNKNAK